MNGFQQTIRYDFVYVDEENFQRHQPKSFAGLVASFTAYKI